MNVNSIVYREFEPDLRLKDYIKSYWYFSIQTSTPKAFDILPDGYFDLLVVIKDNRVVDTLLTGIWSKSISINYSENTEVFGIRFKPLSIGGLFKFNVSDFVDGHQCLALDDLNMSEQVFMDNLNGLSGFLVNYLNKHFLRLALQNSTDQRLKKCFDLIDNSVGNAKVDDISKAIGISSRQLRRMVCKMIGIGIKDYAKIVRFKKSLRDLQNNKSDYFHYYDQSHYIREIKQFTGETPEQLDLKNNDRFIQYYNFKLV